MDMFEDRWYVIRNRVEWMAFGWWWWDAWCDDVRVWPSEEMSKTEE